MPLGNDPTPQSDLETQFGVMSNAAELIASNRERFSSEMRAALAKPRNGKLSAAFDPDPESDDPEDKAEAIGALADHVDEDVQTASVYGASRSAAIVYTYLDGRGAIEKGVVPYADVFGSASAKRAAKREREEDQSPDEAARAAAQAKLDEANDKAAKIAQKAQEDADKVVREATEKAQQIQREATEKAQREQEKAAKQAPKAAEAAAKKAAKQAPASSGS